MRVAFVHYWLVNMRGGEKVLEAMSELYPEADIYTLVLDKNKISPTLLSHDVRTSFLQRIGGVRYYQKMLPLMPFALEALDLTSYDLVISSESGPAKGVVVGPGALHICYCHSPMRYIWDLFFQYRGNAGAVSALAMSIFAPLLRMWDVTTAARVDHFVANSDYVRRRIMKYYRREATVIYPPVAIENFSVSSEPREYYLCAGQVTPYKKVELAVETFTRLKLPLIVVGQGVSQALRRSAGPNVQFVGPVEDNELQQYLSKCRALVFPGVEDFGIVPLEAMACGRPVIAFAAGGALETVKDGETGILFTEQSLASLTGAVEAMEARHSTFDSAAIQAHAERFSRENFKKHFADYVACRLIEHRSDTQTTRTYQKGT